MLYSVGSYLNRKKIQLQIEFVCIYIAFLEGSTHKTIWFPQKQMAVRGCLLSYFILWAFCLILLCDYITIFKGKLSFLKQRMMQSNIHLSQVKIFFYNGIETFFVAGDELTQTLVFLCLFGLNFRDLGVLPQASHHCFPASLPG